MNHNQFSGAVRTILLFVLATLLCAVDVSAATFKILHVFQQSTQNPYGNLTLDAAGNLYGTTAYGGTGNNGVVFKLVPAALGPWTFSIIYRFRGSDGAQPTGGMIFDAAGNLYGVTGYGGAKGNGVVFKLKPNANGTWTETVLHSFKGSDGSNPDGGLVFDTAGNLYGTTQFQNTMGQGVVFKLHPNSNGTWTESVIHSFTEAEGNPYSGVIFDTAGNLYGTTNYYYQGCTGYVCGIVFKLTPNSDGTWTENVLYNFIGGAVGDGPSGPLVFDSTGNLYGTSFLGGSGCYYGCGILFELTPNLDGTWSENVIYTFTGGTDGSAPSGGLTFDAAGNLYGTAQGGGGSGNGVVFKFEPSASGWTETVVHSFGTSGYLPNAPVIFDKAGNLYGTTAQGTNNYGVAYEITP